MVDKITASAETLLRQASMTAADYLRAAVRELDSVFGEGYAQQHPELVAAFMRTAAQDYHTAVSASVQQDLVDALDRVADAIQDVADANGSN